MPYFALMIFKFSFHSVNCRTLFLIALISSLFFQLKTNAQSKTDSLALLVKVQKDDTNKVKTLIALSKQYNLYTTKENLNYLDDALKLSIKIKDKKFTLKLYKSLVLNAYYKGIYDLSLSYCLKYLQYLKSVNEENEKYVIYKTLGNLYLKQGYKSEALRIYHQAREHLEKSQPSFDLGGVYNSLTLFYLSLNKNDSATFYCQKALKQFEAVNQVSAMANSILAMAEIEESKGNLALSAAYARKANKIYLTIKEYHGVCNSLEVIGDLYLIQNKNDSARLIFERSLLYADSAKMYNKKSECYDRLAKANYNLGNYKTAYDYFNLFKLSSDSLNIEQMQGKMLEMEVKYDLQTKDNQLKEKENEIAAQSKIRNLLLAGIAAVILLLSLAVYAYVQKRKSNKEITLQKKAIEDKNKEILDSIRYAKRIQKALVTSEFTFDKYLKQLK